ncbi:MAG: 23S rRNA (uracil(1939)-C(5))-methyltransferase RlmD [Chitinophagales bacterium]|nr:23S rRNA (uracil(1939)-C(5))-methyltransferase RlmD [Chitinophagales bacterium]MDW8393892.1 23S rRNA (uracil(1939)-C(5))-methyltransferase RlmD [Chitinophagales bacterium]
MSTVLDSLLVETFANEGRCIAHHQGQVVLVSGAVPGERVRARITRSRKDYLEAEVLEVLERSPERIEPFCQHYGVCGGCRWQHLAYEAQVKYKQQMVIDTLCRIGKVVPKVVLPIIAAQETRAYRNKLEFTFSHREWLTSQAWQAHVSKQAVPALGFHWPGKFDRVFNVYTCHLQESLSDAIRNSVRDYALQQGLTFFHLKKQTGLLRNLMIRIAATGQVMVVVVFGEWKPELAIPLLEHLNKQFPRITSLMYVVNNKRNDSIYDLEAVTFSGPDYIEERLAGLTFRISAKSFFQTNTRQAEQLVACVREFCCLGGNEQVYDLYCGTGTLALTLAPFCHHVTGVESVAQAIADARMNARINGIGNVHFVTGTVEEALTDDLLLQTGRPDVMVLDPPRAGLHTAVVRRLLELAIPRMVYVSCNVATQARDLMGLSAKYAVERIRPVDLFPHTHHIENVAELRLKG